MIAPLRRLFAYERWANAEALRALGAADPPPPAAVRLLAHVGAAAHLWRARMEGGEPRLAVWPELDPAECRRLLAEEGDAYARLLEKAADADLERAVAYVNSRGEPWRSTVGDILTHVALHSAYHRGQVALALRQAGTTPAYTDFIHCVRQGFLD